LDLLSFYKKRHKTESEYQVWQEGFHPQQIKSLKILNQKIEYIHYNPVKSGLVADPEHWIYNSPCDYVFNRKGLVEIHAFSPRSQRPASLAMLLYFFNY
jgi:hypothetical protein